MNQPLYNWIKSYPLFLCIFPDMFTDLPLDHTECASALTTHQTVFYPPWYVPSLFKFLPPWLYNLFLCSLCRFRLSQDRSNFFYYSPFKGSYHKFNCDCKDIHRGYLCILYTSPTFKKTITSCRDCPPHFLQGTINYSVTWLI